MRVLLVRGQYRKSIEASFCLNTLSSRAGVEVTQFFCFGEPDFPIPPGHPIYSPYLSKNLVADRSEVVRSLRRGEYDLVMLMPGAVWQEGLLPDLARWAGEIPVPIPPLRRMVRRAARLFRVLPESCLQETPTIVLDMGDPSTVDPSETHLLTADRLYFKREIPYDRARLFPSGGMPPMEQVVRAQANLRYLPMGIDDTHYQKLRKLRRRDKETDVFCSGSYTNTLRETALQKIAALRRETNWKIIAHECLQGPPRIEPSEYFRLASGSRVSISIAGRGWDCHRHYEMVALGTVPLMNQPTVDAPAWRGLPEALFFHNSFSDFREKISALLDSPALREEALARCEERIEGRYLWSAMMDFILAETAQRHPQLLGT